MLLNYDKTFELEEMGYRKYKSQKKGKGKNEIILIKEKER